MCYSHLVCSTHFVDNRGVLEQARSHLCHVAICVKSSQCATPILFAPRISWSIVASSSKHDPICAMSVGLVKVLCVFFLSLVQTRSHLCYVGSVCYSHLVCSTHLEDKRGALEQERTSPFHVGSVKVLCVFLSTLEQARIHLCPVGSMCSSHLVCFTHLVDKRGVLEQARSHLCHVGRFSQSVVCVSLNPRASTDSSMPCRFNVLLPSCLLHASRGQAKTSILRSEPFMGSNKVCSIGQDNHTVHFE